ncbi:MAG TPA: hypothetical protein VGL72_19455 [Bryobacteraceae bacterium]|jgi:hypothetical protein
MKTRLRAGGWLLASLVILGIAVSPRFRQIDNAFAVFILCLYVLGSPVLVLKALRFRRAGRKHVFSGGELALLPESWRRWMLDQS